MFGIKCWYSCAYCEISLLLLQKNQKKKRKEQVCPASSAGEAIERMLVEKRISSKINYNVLRDLDKAWEQSSALADSNIEIRQDTTSEPWARLQTSMISSQASASPPQASLPLTVSRGPLPNRLPSLLTRKRPLISTSPLISEPETK